jgi:hypothetical protein
MPIVSQIWYAKYSKWFDSIIFFRKAHLLSKEDWTQYAILGTTEHVKKIIEGENSFLTNICGIGRQFAIATDRSYVRGGAQILEQWSSDKCDWGKVGEGSGYILKGILEEFAQEVTRKLYRPFIGVWQYGVSAGTTVWTAVKDNFFSSTDTHYTYKKAYNDFKESFKIIGAAIDMSPIGMGGGALYYGIKSSLTMIEANLRKLFNLEFDDQKESNVYSNETLRTWRYASVAIAPCLSAVLWKTVPHLAVGGNANFIIEDIVNAIITLLYGESLFLWFKY